MIIIIIILYYPKLVNDFVYDLRAFLVGQLFCKGSGGMVPLMETAKHKEKQKCNCNLCTTRRGKYILVNNKEQTMKVETMQSLLLQFFLEGLLENNRFHIIIASLL